MKPHSAEPAGGAPSLKVVVISYAYPPFPASGSQRARKVAQALRAEGHEVLVLTSRLPGEDNTRPRVEEPGLIVRPVAAWRNPRHLYIGIKRARGAGTSVPAEMPRARDGAASGNGRLAAWKRFLLSLLWLPDDLQGFVPPVVGAVLRRFPQGVDLVYTTSPSHSTHLAGLALKALLGIRWVAEFRDPWTGSDMKRPAVRSALSDRVEEWLERQCVANADQVVAVSEGIAELLASRWGLERGRKLAVVRNGIDERFRRAMPPSGATDVFRMVHLGTFSLRRDPATFLEALAIVKRELSLSASDFEVHLIGQGRTFAGRPVKPAAAALGVLDLLHFEDWIPHDRAPALLAASDLLLLFAQQQPLQVPNKLYEYLGVGRPILALADAEGETARMLERVGGHYIVTREDPTEIAAAIRAAILRHRAGEVPSGDAAVLEEWRTEVQMRKLRDFVFRGGAPTR